jgi:antitoxin HicB
MKKRSANILTYDVVFEEAVEGGYTVSVPSLPGCISEGDTFEKAITAYLESLSMDGEKMPEGGRETFIGHVVVPKPSILS